MADQAQPVQTVRGITAPCHQCGGQSLSFDMPDGSVLRLRLTAQQLDDLRGFLGDIFPRGQAVRCRTCAQSASDGGSPQVDGSSNPPGQSQAPAHKSSSAAEGE